MIQDLIPGSPAHNHRHGIITRCYSCKYCRKHSMNAGDNRLKGKINGKTKTIRVKYGEIYCTYNEIFKINRNHIRWWGFSRNCPFNIYSHTCLGCGIRMCSPKKVCGGCLKNNERFNTGFIKSK